MLRNRFDGLYMTSKEHKDRRKNEEIEDYNEIMEKVRNQPGLEEFFKVMGQYNQLKANMEFYLGITQPKIISTATDSTD